MHPADRNFLLVMAAWIIGLTLVVLTLGYGLGPW